MHRALYIEEILLNILHHLHVQREKWHSRYANVDLVTLARTCSVFKEPALDMIWAELNDFTPLVRCLPRECLETSQWDPTGTPYSFRKSEWDIILRYSRRVRAFPHLHDSFGLDEDGVEALSDPPVSAELIFPNLHIVGLRVPSLRVVPLVRLLMSPSVTTLSFEGWAISEAAVNGFGKGCPYVTNFAVSQWTRNETISALICNWESLCSVRCASVTLTMDTLSRLSRSRSLFRMAFTVDEAIADEIQAPQPFVSVLTFPELLYLHLRSLFPALAGKFFHYFRAPILRAISVVLVLYPNAQDLKSLLVDFHKVSSHTSLHDFHIRVRHEPILPPTDDEFCVTFAHLHPLTVFVNIKSIRLDIPWVMDLNESELLTLASSWPCLERLQFGKFGDWTPASGITPEGFLQLLERCTSLRELYCMFDTRGYTEIPRGDPWRGLRMPTNALLHVLESPIEEESVGALAVFFHVAPYPDFSLVTRFDGEFEGNERHSEELCELYRARWSEVRTEAYNLWRDGVL